MLTGQAGTTSEYRRVDLRLDFAILAPDAGSHRGKQNNGFQL
jgi:hypothetical protein